MTRVDFEMTEDEYDAILNACRPVPYLVMGGTEPRSQQENANAAWRALGEKRGFDYMTVRAGRSARHFTAEATS